MAFVFAEALARQLGAIGVVDEAVEDGVGDDGIADDFVPAIEWRRARSQSSPCWTTFDRCVLAHSSAFARRAETMPRDELVTKSRSSFTRSDLAICSDAIAILVSNSSAL